MNQAVKLLRDLIVLPSVNPAFVPKDDPRGGEHRVADYLAALAARAGLVVEFQPVLPGRANLLARLPAADRPARRVVLAPHLDTVPDADPGQLVPQAKNGRIYGRGACDTKGSVAAMFSALLAVARQPRRPRQMEIVFAGLMDEESTQAGSRVLAGSGLAADLAIVGEPTQCRVITAHKGDLWLTLTTHGKAAHGACPHRGRNAVREMARVVECLETEYAAQLRQRYHPLLGRPTVNVGVIRGGTQPNIVPDECCIQIDRRLIPGETEVTVRRELQALLRARGLRADIADSKGVPCLSLETDASLPLVRAFMRAAGCRRPAGVDFFCDASILAHGGIPSVVFGPGNLAQAHTKDEWVAIAQVERATAILTRFLSELP